MKIDEKQLLKELNQDLKIVMFKYLEIKGVENLRITANITKGINDIKIEFSEFMKI